jgi:hypothetical protein
MELATLQGRKATGGSYTGKSDSLGQALLEVNSAVDILDTYYFIQSTSSDKHAAYRESASGADRRVVGILSDPATADKLLVTRLFHRVERFMLHKRTNRVALGSFMLLVTVVLLLMLFPGERDYFTLTSLLANFVICIMCMVGWFFTVGKHRTTTAGIFTDDDTNMDDVGIPHGDQTSMTSVQRMHILWSEIQARKATTLEDTAIVEGVVSANTLDLCAGVSGGLGFLLMVWQAIAGYHGTPLEQVMGYLESIMTFFGAIASGMGIAIYLLDVSLLIARVKLFNKEMLLSGQHSLESVTEQLLKSQQTQKKILTRGMTEKSLRASRIASGLTGSTDAGGGAVGGCETWSVAQVKTWISSLSNISQAHIEQFTKRAEDQDLDGAALCTISAEQLQELLGATYGDNMKLAQARSKLMSHVTGFQDSDEFFEEYIMLKNYFVSASKAWQLICTTVMMLGMLSFLIGAVMMLLKWQGLFISVVEMILGVFFFFFMAGAMLNANVACNSLKGTVVNSNPGNFDFFGRSNQGHSRGGDSNSHRNLISYLELNPIYFVLFGFAITPAWLFGFASGTGGTAIVAFIYRYVSA